MIENITEDLKPRNLPKEKKLTSKREHVAESKGVQRNDQLVIQSQHTQQATEHCRCLQKCYYSNLSSSFRKYKRVVKEMVFPSIQRKN